MRLVLAAFAFGVLIFFAGSAALSLEPPPQGPGIGHLSLLMLGTLQALTGLIAIVSAASLDRQSGPHCFRPQALALCVGVGEFSLGTRRGATKSDSSVWGPAFATCN